MTRDLEIDSRQSLYSWVVLVVSLVMASLSFGAVTAVPILMQPMAEDLGWGLSVLGLAHSLAMISAGTVGLVIGMLTDRYRFVWLSTIAGASIGLGLWLSSVARTPMELYVSYALLVGAVGQGTFFGPITANVSHWFDRNRSFAIAVVLSGQSIGGLTVPVFLRLLAENVGWRLAMSIYGLVCGVSIILASTVFLKSPRSEPISSPNLAVATTTLRSDCNARNLTIFCAITVPLILLNSGSFILIAHFVSLSEEAGIAPSISAGLLALMLGTTLISRIGGGIIGDRFSQKPVIFLCSLMLPIGLLFVLKSNSSTLAIVIGSFIFGLGYGGVFPAYTGIIRSTFSARFAGTWISLMFFFGFLAAAFGSWVGGALRDYSGDYELSLWTGISLTVSSFLISLLLFTRTGFSEVRER